MHSSSNASKNVARVTVRSELSKTVIYSSQIVLIDLNRQLSASYVYLLNLLKRAGFQAFIELLQKSFYAFQVANAMHGLPRFIDLLFRLLHNAAIWEILMSSGINCYLHCVIRRTY